MALFEDFLGESLGGPALLAIGAVIAAPAVLPILRPVVKVAVMGGLAAIDAVRYIAAEVGEQVGDMVAEARADYATRRGQPQSEGHQVVMPGETTARPDATIVTPAETSRRGTGKG